MVTIMMVMTNSEDGHEASDDGNNDDATDDVNANGNGGKGGASPIDISIRLRLSWPSWPHC